MVIDAHAHVYRNPPGHHAPWPVENYLRKLADNRVDGGVLVQPSFLGTDHSELTAALAAGAGRFRGIGVIESGFSAAQIDELHRAGVRGIRLNFFRGATEDLSSRAWREIFGLLAQRGWHVELNARDETWSALIERIRGLPVPITVDHFGRPEPELGPASPGFKSLLEFAKRQAVFLKLTAAFRTPLQMAKDCTKAWLAEIGPQRALWGSDCPWVEMNAPPSYAQTLSWVDDCVEKTADKAAVLGLNAKALFDFAG